MRLFSSTFRKIWLLLQAGFVACMLAALVMQPGVASAHSATSAAPGPSLNAAPTNCPTFPGEPKRQLRGVWIATVANIDWPSQPGLPAATQQQEYINLLDQAQHMGLNAVFVQVRPAADAFYPSQYAPWSQYLTGVQGKDPGYDPLAFMIQETHKRNMEFHAWFNPYRVSLQSDINKLAPNSPARQHPDWVVSYGGQLYFNPGIPGVRQLIEKSIMEVVHKYDIDGVHFDDYFYPYPVAGQDFPDQATYEQYGAAQFPNKADWRRDNVNKLIHELDDEIHWAKHWVKFGVSPFGVWRNIATDPTGSNTTAGVQDYDDLYADTRTWIKHNWLDYIAPQIYWNIGFAPAAYDVLVPWWSHEVEGTNVHLYIGQAAYKIAANNAAWNNPEEMPNHLKFNLQYSAVKGDIYFSMKDLLRNPLGFEDRLVNDLYKHPALVPVMPWLGGHAPHHPVLNHVQQTSQGVTLRWLDVPPFNNTTYYAIYRFSDHGAQNACDFENPQNLLTTLRKLTPGMQQSFVDTTAAPGQTYTYYVTALDRLDNESAPSNGQTITVQ